MRKTFIKSNLWLVAVMLFGISLFGRYQVVTGPDFILGSGEHIHGSLIALSGNVELKENSRVTGSTIVLCCNLTANGEVDGSIQMLTGNLTLGPQALVKRDIRLVTGDFMELPTSQVGGQVSTDNSAELLVMMVLVAMLALAMTLVVLIIIVHTVFEKISMRNNKQPTIKGNPV